VVGIGFELECEREVAEEKGSGDLKEGGN